MRPGISQMIRATAVFAILSSGSATSASTFQASVADTGSFQICGSLGPSPASGSWVNNAFGAGSSSATGFSTGLGLGGSLLANSSGTGPASNSNASCFKAETIIDDVIISGPAGQVSLQVTAVMDGWITLSSAGAADVSANWHVGVEFGETGGPLVGLNQVVGPGYVTGADTAVGTTLTTSWNGTFPVNVPLTVRLFASAGIVAMDNFSPGPASASIPFLNMGFPVGTPVFTLPTGYTANSADGLIVDNQFVGPPPVPSLTPSGLIALIAVLGYLGVARRRPGS